ncbi:hypothetical protein GCM10009565_17320 [Amycolatopsis albidoflavus]
MPSGEGEHFIGHVETDGAAFRPDATGGKQYVQAAAGAEVEDSFAGPQIGDCKRISAAQTSGCHRFGDVFFRVVHRAESFGSRQQAGGFARQRSSCGIGIAVTDRVLA